MKKSEAILFGINTGIVEATTCTVRRTMMVINTTESTENVFVQE